MTKDFATNNILMAKQSTHILQSIYDNALGNEQNEDFECYCWVAGGPYPVYLKECGNENLKKYEMKFPVQRI